MKKRVLMTGASGTIGKPFKEYLEGLGFEVISWNRMVTPIDDYFRMEEFVKETNPVALYHLAAVVNIYDPIRENAWKVNYEWTSELAWICRILKIKFIFTSTGMVFSGKNGPYTVNSTPDSAFGYGYEKRMAEERIFYQNPDSVVLRLGWQIAPEGNNSMVSSLDEQMNGDGCIHASENWFPSCSTLDETMRILHESLNYKPGIYMVNSNKDYNFFQIVNRLKEKFEKDWNIIRTKDPVSDQRMLDERVKVKLNC